VHGEKIGGRRRDHKLERRDVLAFRGNAVEGLALLSSVWSKPPKGFYCKCCTCEQYERPQLHTDQ
jgi:hypothetical protein